MDVASGVGLPKIVAPCVRKLSFSSAARDTLTRMGTSVTGGGSGDRSRPVLATLTALYLLELIGILCAATAFAVHSAGLPTLALLGAAALVGWHAMRLLQGRRVLGVAGLAVQSILLIGAIALATQRPAAGVAGAVVAAGVLAAWGRLGRPARPVQPLTATAEVPSGSDGVRLGLGGVVLVLLTSALVLAALSVRGGIVIGMVVLAVIFIPLERLFALRPRRILRAGWRTDLVHYLVNGAALKVGTVVAVVVVGTVLRAFVPPPVRSAIAASPGWAQIIAALAIATVGGYAGHRDRKSVV